MSVEQVARAQYDTQAALARRAAEAAQAWWALVDLADLDGSWSKVATRLQVAVGAAQTLAASSADSYTAAALAAQGVKAPAAGRVDPLAFSGVASDGRPLDSLLYEPVIATKAAIGAGVAPAEAKLRGLASLVRIAATQVQDAGRAAGGVAIASRPRVTGYVRMLNPPSCARCSILAGKWFRWNTGFQRHPHCDCIHVPAAEDASDLRTDPRAYFDSLSPAEQDRVFTKAGAQAIRDGSDLGQVVNARRGMQTAQVYGHQLKTTLEGITTRGVAGQRLGELAKAKGQRYRASTTPRLMPESIYEIAGGNRDEAIRLLKRYGYLI